MKGLYKTEVVRNRRQWRGLDDLEIATLDWVDWFNHRRIFHELGRIPPAEYETNHYRQTDPENESGFLTTEHARLKPGEVHCPGFGAVQVDEDAIQMLMHGSV